MKKSQREFCMQYLRHFLIFTIFIFTLSSCTSKPVETMRTGSVLWPGYEPLFTARSLGYYDDQPIKLIDYLSNTDAIRAFKNGALEACAFTLDEVLILIGEGVELEIVLIMDVSDGGDVILANPGIKSVSELKGKRVGIESSAVGAYVGSRAFELAGLKKGDVEIVSILASEAETAFKSGQIDAAVTFDPHRSKLLKHGKVEIFNSKEIEDEVIDVLVVRKDYKQKHPEVVQTLIKGWFKSLQYAEQKPYESAVFGAKRQQVSVDEYLQSLKLMKFPDKQENIKLLDSKASPLNESSKKLLEVLEELGHTYRDIKLSAYLDNTFIKEI